MSEESLLGIDIGTASSKGVLVRPDGTLIAQARQPHTLSLPQPGFAEHDADEVWWRDIVKICAELAPFAGNGLRGICVSGIGPCVVPCDRTLRPLRPAILYGIDTRATAEVTEIEHRLGRDEILARSGSVLSSQALGPKLLWLRRHEPNVWAQTAGWYMASSFVAARLTGAYVLDHHSASQCDPLYDLATGDWAADWADEVAPGVPLPQLVWPSEIVGRITVAAAAETGLPQGTPVAAGTVDAWAEAFSAGVRRPGDLMLMYGSTMFLVAVVEDATPSPLLWCTEGVEPHRRTLAAGTSTAGSLTEWLRELFGGPSWDNLTSEAAVVPPGSHGLLVLPYFAGERTPIYDPAARGIVAGLTLRHTRADLLHAAYEGVAFGIKQVLTSFADAGASPKRVVAVGGGTDGDVWLQILSDVTGLDQIVPEQTIGASYGDALLAAIGTGCVPADADWASAARVVEPDHSLRSLYDDLSEAYSELYRSTSSIAHRLAALERVGGRGQ